MGSKRKDDVGKPDFSKPQTLSTEFYKGISRVSPRLSAYDSTLGSMKCSRMAVLPFSSMMKALFLKPPTTLTAAGQPPAPVRVLGAGQLVEHLGEPRIAHGVEGVACGDAQGVRDLGLSRARCAGQHADALLRDSPAVLELQHLRAVELAVVIVAYVGDIRLWIAVDARFKKLMPDYKKRLKPNQFGAKQVKVAARNAHVKRVSRSADLPEAGMTDVYGLAARSLGDNEK